jgi:hypothetical protein
MTLWITFLIFWRRMLSMDKNGYPDPEELESIRTWPAGYGPTGNRAHRDLMEYVKGLWMYADANYWTDKGVAPHSLRSYDRRSYSISTGGWSGNEDIIQAMESNIMFWATCWVSSKRGGHYEFEVKL